MYQARILDKNRKLVAILPGVRWLYNRRINEATSVEVYIPREVVDKQITQDHELYGFFAPSQPFAVQGKPARAKPNKAQYAEIASFIQIYKGDVLKASGKIVGRTLGQVVTVFAATEEILMESSTTPAQYGAVWDGWDLADVARDLLDGWQTLRTKAPEQWQDRMVASSNVDLTTDPGLVMLAKRPSGRYYDSGYITLLFNKNEIDDFKGWDRIRWSADSDGPGGTVQTTVQWSSNGTSFTTPFDGGLPEEIGLYVGGDHDQVWVRINLTTEDTESPVPNDPNETPVGVSPTVFACELIARTHGDLVIGSIPSVAGATVAGLSANHATALKVLHEACDQVGWEFSVWDGALNVAENMGVDRTKDFVFRTGTNIEIASLGDGDDSLVNILTAQGPGRGINRLEITLRDEASIQKYGPYPNREPVEFNIDTLAELQQKAQEYLDEHSTPQMDFAITVDFEHGQEPNYGLGDTVRVADPDTGIISETRIVEEARELGADGLIVNLELGKPSFSLTEAIGRDGKDGKDGKDGRDGKDGKDGEQGPPGSPGEDYVPPIPQVPQWLGHTLTTSGLTIRWLKAEHANGYEIRTDLNWGNSSGMVFRGYAHELSFVPQDRNVLLYIKSINVQGDYSAGYDTLQEYLAPPPAPSQPDIAEFFRTIRIAPVPLNDPAVQGYYAYITVDETTEKRPVMAGSYLLHQLEYGKTATIQVAAYDILGEGAKSEPIQAASVSLDDEALEDEIKALLIKAQAGFFEEADVIKLWADRLYVGDNIELGDNKIVVVKGDPPQRLEITEDTFIVPSDNINYSTSELLIFNVQGQTEIFIKIPNTSVPEGIKEVSLYLYSPGWSHVVEGENLTDPVEFSVSAVPESWDYQTITGQNRPTGYYYEKRYAVSPEPGWVRLDITQFVKDWAIGMPRYGLRIHRASQPVDTLFRSSRYSNPDYRPYVVYGEDPNKAVFGDLGGLPWQSGVIPQGTPPSLYVVNGYFRGDISGSSGEFADGKIRIGDISGKPWGNSFLPAETSGLWGDEASIYMRGYPRLIVAGSGFDESVVDLTDHDGLGDVEVLVAPKELVTSTSHTSESVVIYTDVVKDPNELKFTLKAKSIIKSPFEALNSGRAPTTAGWELVLPSQNGVMTDFIVCRPIWEVYWTGFNIMNPPLEYAELWMDITDQYTSGGNPTNWQNIKHYKTTTWGSGTLNWDTTMPQKSQWSVRIRGTGGYESYTSPLGDVDVYARSGLDYAGYRGDNKYLDAEGNVIQASNPATSPSGMSLLYFVFDKG